MFTRTLEPDKFSRCVQRSVDPKPYAAWRSINKQASAAATPQESDGIWQNACSQTFPKDKLDPCIEGIKQPIYKHVYAQLLYRDEDAKIKSYASAAIDGVAAQKAREEEAARNVGSATTSKDARHFQAIADAYVDRREWHRQLLKDNFNEVLCLPLDFTQGASSP